ncbi:hypothetical protein [Deinococcus proteolyticus]|nr:hypothetical protein [Deinococcus proteolyticus]
MRRIYADGGQVVQDFIRARLLDELTLATVLLNLLSSQSVAGGIGAEP